MTERQTNAQLAERLRTWYEKGRGGLETVCRTEGAPPAVLDAVRRWFDLGFARMDAICTELEREDDADGQ